mgnify:CR=1 FL=1
MFVLTNVATGLGFKTSMQDFRKTQYPIIVVLEDRKLVFVMTNVAPGLGLGTSIRDFSRNHEPISVVFDACTIATSLGVRKDIPRAMCMPVVHWTVDTFGLAAVSACHLMLLMHAVSEMNKDGEITLAKFATIVGQAHGPRASTFMNCFEHGGENIVMVFVIN